MIKDEIVLVVYRVKSIGHMSWTSAKGWDNLDGSMWWKHDREEVARVEGFDAAIGMCKLANGEET